MKTSLALLLSAITLLSSGCTIKLQHDPLAPTTPVASTITTTAKSTGLRNGRVGWGRFSAFAIPVAPVHIRGDDNEELMRQVHSALRHAGFDVQTEQQNAEADMVLHVHVKQISYSNYTWFVPFVPTWGDMDIEFSLKDRSGNSVWSQTYHGSGFTMNFTDGYTIAAAETLKEIFDQFIASTNSEAFRMALNPATETPSESTVVAAPQ